MTKFEQLDWENIDLNDTNYFIHLFEAMSERRRGIYAWINEIYNHQYKTYEILLQMVQNFQQVIDDGWILDDAAYYNDAAMEEDTSWTNSNWRPYLKVWTPILIIEETGVNYREFTYGDIESYKNCLLGIKLGLELLTKKPINDFCVYKKASWGNSVSGKKWTLQTMQGEIDFYYQSRIISIYDQYDKADITSRGTKNPVMDFGNISQSVIIEQFLEKKTIAYKEEDGETYVNAAQIAGSGYKLHYLGGKSCKLKNIIARLKNEDKGTITYGYDDVKFGINFIDLNFTFTSENRFYEDFYLPTSQIPTPVYQNPVDDEGKYVTISLYYDVYILPYLDFGVDSGFEYY